MPVRTERNGAVFTVILDRPDARNAVDRPHAEALTQAFHEFEKDEGTRVAVLWGAGGHFCAGADLKAVSSGDSARINRVDAEGDGPMGPTRMALSKPVIAAVSGFAVAGGLELACWCDLRVAERSAQFGVFCRRWGVPLIDGGTIRLPRLIGMSRALDLILTGRAVGADEALAMGLANRVVADGQARAEAEKLAAQIAEFPQTCMRHDRLSAHQQWPMTLSEALANEFHHGMESLKREARAGATRFKEGAGRHGKFE